MPFKTPEDEASYALAYGVDRSELTDPGRLAYDQLVADRAAGVASRPSAPTREIPACTPPDVRARILQMFKTINPKYARPFESRLARASFLGGDWEEYGQIVLQMAILDTLLSIEELLARSLEGERQGEGQL
jgi:hypothetical protein